MGNTNSTNQKIKDFFNNSKFKDIFGKIGSGFAKIINFGENMLNNMMKMSMNLSNLMSTGYFPYIILFVGGCFIAIRLKLI